MNLRILRYSNIRHNYQRIWKVAVQMIYKVTISIPSLTEYNEISGIQKQQHPNPKRETRLEKFLKNTRKTLGSSNLTKKQNANAGDSVSAFFLFLLFVSSDRNRSSRWEKECTHAKIKVMARHRQSGIFYCRKNITRSRINLNLTNMTW